MDFKSLIGLIKKPKSPVEELERALENIDIPAAETKVETLEKQRREMLLSGSNDEVAALDLKIRDANLDVERLAAMQETLTQRIAAMKSQGAEEIRRKAYVAAQGGYDTAREILQDYEKNAKAIVACIGKLAELDKLIDTTNADLPEGVEALQTVEAKVRGLPAEPRREVKQEVVRHAWYYEGSYMPSAAIPEEMASGLSGNSGTIMDYSRSGTGTPIKVRRCKVVKVTYRNPVDALGAHVLSGFVRLPGVLPGQPMIWGEGQSHTTSWAKEGYNRDTVIQQAADVMTARVKPHDPRQEPFLEHEVRIVPLDVEDPGE